MNGRGEKGATSESFGGPILTRGGMSFTARITQEEKRRIGYWKEFVTAKKNLVTW